MFSAPMLYLGDCLAVLPSIGPVDLILADMPYGTTQCKWDSRIPLDLLWPELKRICPKGPIILFAQSPFDKVLGASNIDNLRYEWIWEKGNATGYLNAKRAPLKAHENILVFCSGAPFYNPQKTTGHPRKTSKGNHSEIYNPVKRTPYDSTERYPRSVLKFSSEKQTRRTAHPTAKPLKLLEYLINTHSAPNALILDFCMGSGSAGIAALYAGRQFIGIEKDPKFFAIAESSIASLHPPTSASP